MAPNENLDDLERAIGQLRKCVKMLAVKSNKTAISIEYLVKLQADIEAIGMAIKEERWEREGSYEFLGE
jgi:hypothetical protein